MAFKSSSDSSANLDIRNRGGTEEQQQQQQKKKKVKKLRSMKLSKMPSLKPSRRRLKSQFDHFAIDSSIVDDDDASSELSQADIFGTSSDAKGKIFPEGNEFDGASFGSSSHRSSSSSSKTAFSSRNYSTTRGGIEFRKTLKKSRSSRWAKSRLDQTISSLSSNASPNYLKATSCSGRKNTHFQASSVHDSESTFNSVNENKRNSHTSRTKSGSSGLKYMQTLRRTTSLRTLRVLLNKSSVNRATCSSTLKDSKFPHNLELHQEEGESERISVAKVCPYNYCSLHGHRRSPAPPLKRLLSKRRRFLKTQKSMKLRTHSSLRRKENFRRSGQGNEDAYLAKVLFGETSYAAESVEENLNQGRNSTVAEQDILETLSKNKETKLVGLENDDLPGVSVESSHMVPRSAPDNGREAAEDNSVISSASVCHTLEELGGATEDKTFAQFSLVGDSKEVYKSHLHKKKHISLWHLIHQHMVSGLAEGAGTDEKKQVGDTNRLATPPSPGRSPSFSDSQIANHDTDSQEIEVRKTYAIKMVRQAIEKILLPEVQDQPVSSDVTSDDELLEKKRGEGGEQSIPTITADKISGPKQEVTAAKEGKEADHKAPKTWSNLKKLILLKRFIKELEKVRKFNPRKRHHLPSEPGQEAEKVCLRHPRMDRKKSSEEWMLDYALQQVVSEMAPTQKRKVMLLIKAFETVVPPSDEQQIQLTFPKFKRIISHDSCCTETEPDNNVSEATYRDTKAEEIVMSNLYTGDKNSITTGHNIASNSASDNGPFKQSVMLRKGKNGDSKSPVQVINMYDQQSPLPGHEHSHFNSPAKNSEFCSVDNPEASADNNLISSACVGGPLKELITPSREQRNGDSEQEIESIEAFGPGRDSEPYHSNHEGYKIEFDKEKHVSMWHLIHQRMVAALAVEGKTTKHLDKANKQHLDDANTPAAKESSCSSPELNDSFQNTAVGYRDVDTQEVELRKIYAIKLVREAIEKILLPEVQDRSSDDQSTTSEIMSDQELLEKNNWEDSSVACDSNEVRNDTSFNPEGTKLAAAISVSEDDRTAPKVQNKSDKQTPKGWSNLKKLILLKRFVKELEKVRKFNPGKPQHLPLKPHLEAEEVSLRHQLMDERRSAEEWMLDYALRKVVSELAPKQKRKVALLVKAFETVAPPSEEEPQIEVIYPKLKVSFCDSCDSGSEEDKFASIATEADMEVEDVSPSNLDKISTITGKKSNVAMDVEAQKDTLSSFRLELLKDGNESNGTNTRLDGLTGEKPLYGTKSVASFWNRESEATYNIASSTSNSESLNQPIPAKEQEKYISMWHMLCQHVVSAVATKVERQLLDGESEDEQLDGAKTSPQIRTGSSHDHTMAEGRKSGSQKVKFSQRHAVKLVEEAIEEILHPDIQDDSSDAQSISSDIIPEQEEEILEKNRSNVSIDSPKDSFREYNKSEVLDHNIINQEEKVSMVGNKSDQKEPRNWSKLKKLILLKRSIRALEKVRKCSNPQAPRNLPLEADQGENSEKVDLRHQLQDERKKAEEWMLDYSLQHIVTKLTPARKRRVSMLVEAFEAVVPLPDI